MAKFFAWTETRRQAASHPIGVDRLGDGIRLRARRGKCAIRRRDRQSQQVPVAGERLALEVFCAILLAPLTGDSRGELLQPATSLDIKSLVLPSATTSTSIPSGLLAGRTVASLRRLPAKVLIGLALVVTSRRLVTGRGVSAPVKLFAGHLR